MFWDSIEYEWGGGGCCTALLLWLARACPKHKKVFEGRSTLPTTACKVSTSYLKSKVFLEANVCDQLSYVLTMFYRRGFYGENTESIFFVIISLQSVGFSPNLVEMFFSTIPMQCPSQNSKFENLRHFIGGSEHPWWMGGGGGGGGVLYRTFAGIIGHDRKKDFSIFFFHNKGKGKNRTYPKGFLISFFKIAQNSSFRKVAVQHPPPPPFILKPLS